MASKTKLVAIVGALWLSLGQEAAFACDNKTARCQKLNEMVVAMDYAAGIGKARAACEQRALGWRPDSMPLGQRHILKGLNKASADWPKVEEAFTTYVQEACGGQEIEYLILEGYRIAWDGRAPAAALDAALNEVRAGSGEVRVKATVGQVSLDVNKAIGPLLESMAAAAMRNYQNRLTAIATGEFMAMIGSSCAPQTPGTVKDGRERLVWPPNAGS